MKQVQCVYVYNGHGCKFAAILCHGVCALRAGLFAKRDPGMTIIFR